MQLTTDESDSGRDAFQAFAQLINPQSSDNFVPGERSVTVTDFTLPEQAVHLADDDIALHVSPELCSKIWNGAYVNLAQLLRKESSPGRGSNLTVNEHGQIEIIPKATKQISTIREWTDAFLIYTYIIIKKYPSKAGELMQYMATIREAEGRNGSSFGWRTYDENFRLRQAVSPMPWGKIHVDLWLKTMSMSGSHVGFAKSTAAQASFQNNNPRPKNVCFEFNSVRGCRFTNCKYLHRCLICKGEHTQIKCNQKTPTGQFNPTFRR